MAKKQLLPKEAAEVLTEESVGAIEGAIKDKIELQVEAALTQQDDIYAEKLLTLTTLINYLKLLSDMKRSLILMLVHLRKH